MKIAEICSRKEQNQISGLFKLTLSILFNSPEIQDLAASKTAQIIGIDNLVFDIRPSGSRNMEAKKKKMVIQFLIFIIYCSELLITQGNATVHNKVRVVTDKSSDLLQNSISVMSEVPHIKTDNNSNDIFNDSFTNTHRSNTSINEDSEEKYFYTTPGANSYPDEPDVSESAEYLITSEANFTNTQILESGDNNTEHLNGTSDDEYSISESHTLFNGSESYILFNESKVLLQTDSAKYSNNDTDINNETRDKWLIDGVPNSETEGMKEIVLPDVFSRSLSTAYTTVKRSENLRLERQVNFNKAGRRARLPMESNNALKKDAENPPTIPRSPLTPNIDVVNGTDPGQNFSEANSTRDKEIKEFLKYIKAGRAAPPPVLFGSSNDQCKLQSGENGLCTPLVNCEYILKTFRSQNPVICRFIKEMPVVCCPQSEVDEPKFEPAPPLGRRFPEVIGCGKRPIPGISGSNRVLRQVARIIPDFSTPVNGTRNQKPVIAGGKDAVIGAWPWMAGIYTRNFGIENFLCGATIMDQYHLVTAAHCFGVSGRSSGRLAPSRYAIRVGSIKVRDGVLHLIDKITIHPDYTPREYYNDIAVIRLKEPIQFDPNAQPICLPVTTELRRKKLKGKDVIVVGWGDLEFGGKRAAILQEVTVQVIDPPTCDRAYLNQRGTSIPHGITNQFLCAGVPEGGKDACQRDSGGPLMLLEGDVWFLVGVVSFGFQCAQAGYPGVYTRVTSYLDWLQQETSMP